MNVLVILATLTYLANLVQTSEIEPFTSRKEPERHHHHHHHYYHGNDQILGPYLDRLLNRLARTCKSSNVASCADNKDSENTDTINETLRSEITTNFSPNQIMVVIPSPSGDPTWTMDEVAAAANEPNNELKEAINKAYRTFTENHSTGDIENFEVFGLPDSSMLVPLTMTSTNIVESQSNPDAIPELIPYEEDLRSESPEPCVIPVPSTIQVEDPNHSDNLPAFIPFIEPTRKKAEQDDVDKKKLNVVIPSPVGARTWTAGELMNAVGILDKSDKYKAVLKRAYDIVKQKIYNGELQNFRTIEVTMPASEISKWTSDELENALRSRRFMPSSEKRTDRKENGDNKQLAENTTEEILSTVAPDDLLH